MRHFLALHPQTRLLLIEAFVWLGCARFVVFMLPTRWYTAYLGSPNQATSDSVDHETQQMARRVTWVINGIAPRTPWLSNCLARAIAAKIMLQRRGYASTLYLGINQVDPQMEAHAWLRCGEQIVTGDDERPRFTPVSCFGET